MTAFKRRIGDTPAAPTTFVAPSANIVGTITGEGPYVFCGRVEGDCDVNGTVTVADGGHWKGTVRAKDVIVSGEVDGDVVAAHRMEISATGRVTGTLTGHSIAIAEGAVIEGEIRVSSGEKPIHFEEKRKA